MLLLAAGSLAPGWAFGAQLTVRAEPERVAVDSGGAAIIVEVRTDSGEPAKDGTQVQFAATLGTITPVAETVGGVARAVLTSSSAGTSQVTVLVGGERVQAFVEFVGDTGQARSESRLARLSGGYVAYSVERQVFLASDKARLEYQGLEVSAESLQFDLGRNLVKAQHLVRVEGSGGSLEGERLCYWGASRSGVLLRVDPERGVERIFFRGGGLDPQPERALAEGAFQPIEAADTRAWVVARQATIFPNEKIQLTGCSLYMDDVHLLDLPIYVIPLRGSGGGNAYLDQVFRLDSQGGLSVDFPLYYAASAHRTGSLHVRHVGSGSYAGYGAPGWSLGIVEQYQRGRDISGTLALQDVTENTRGLRWDHHHQVGSGRLDLYLNYYRYDPRYPGISTAYSHYYRRMKDAGLTVAVRATRYNESTDLASDVSYRWSGRRVPKTNIGYDFALQTGYGLSPRRDDTPYYVYESPREEFYYGVDAGLYPPGKDLDRRTTFTTSFGADYARFLDGGTRDSLEARATVRRSLGRVSSAALSYSYSLRHGDWYAGAGRQRLDLNIYAAKGQTWDLYSYVSKNLSGDSMFGSATFSYQLPFEKLPDGGSKWRFDAQVSQSRYGDVGLTDTRFALARDIGSYEILLCYSPQGSGAYGPYGYASGSQGKKVWVELGARGW